MWRATCTPRHMKKKLPWLDKRPSRHDELCAFALDVFSEDGFGGETLAVEVEKELEYGSSEKYADIYIHGEDDGQKYHVIIEIKTQDESASAGDIIRQLKWYRAGLKKSLDAAGRGDESVRLVLVHDGDPSRPALRLLAHAGVTVIVWDGHALSLKVSGTESLY